jgi:hypothetical protein
VVIYCRPGGARAAGLRRPTDRTWWPWPTSAAMAWQPTSRAPSVYRTRIGSSSRRSGGPCRQGADASGQDDGLNRPSVSGGLGAGLGLGLLLQPLVGLGPGDGRLAGLVQELGADEGVTHDDLLGWDGARRPLGRVRGRVHQGMPPIAGFVWRSLPLAGRQARFRWASIRCGSGGRELRGRCDGVGLDAGQGLSPRCQPVLVAQPVTRCSTGPSVLASQNRSVIRAGALH